eukprot:9480314-Pyramimonas_sp.AAC.1
MQTSVNATLASTATSVTNSCTALSTQVERRLAPLEATVRDHTTQIAEVMAEIKQLRTELGVAKSSTPAPPPTLAGANFDRPPDPTIIVLRCQSLVSKEGIREMAKHWLAQGAINDDQWEILGD